MPLVSFESRIRQHNPIWPYTWTAQYADGSSLSQFSGGHYHYSHEIDKAKLDKLMILGHPDSPITLPRPYQDRLPDDIVIKAECSYQVPMGIDTGALGRVHKTAQYVIGYRYGDEYYFLRIDEHGRLSKECGDGDHQSKVAMGSGWEHSYG